MIASARIASGDSDRNVGCGTGVLARAAADRVATEIQINPPRPE
jgi:hypothetical protein